MCNINFQTAMGVLRLGFISSYLSDQLVQGLTTGAAFHVFTNQIPLLFGIRDLPKTSQPLGILIVRSLNYDDRLCAVKLKFLVLLRIFPPHN